MQPQPYTYKALVTSVHDGDTFTSLSDHDNYKWLENNENGTHVVTKGVTESAIQWAAVVSKLIS